MPVYCFHKIVCYLHWIQRLSTLIMLAFLNTVQQRKDRKYSLVVLTSVSTYYHAHRKCAGAPEIWIPSYYGHTAVVPMVSTLQLYT